MFKMTIEGETLSDLADGLFAAAAQFQTAPAADDLKPARKAKAKASPAPQPEAEEIDSGEGGDEDLLAPADQVQPETSKQVVDAGTGKPAPAQAETIKMTFDDVKVAAAKLVAKDQAKLAEILKKYEAANLSGVSKEKLGDFAADVMEALEA